jgi:hypothetical protein
MTAHRADYSESAPACIRCESSSNIDDDEYDVLIDVARLIEGHSNADHPHPYLWIVELLEEGEYDASYGDYMGGWYTCTYEVHDRAELIRQATAWYEANPEIVAAEELPALVAQ